MSHFPVLVVGPEPESQLAPFDEAIEVDSYEEDCCCIGLIAKMHGRTMAEKKYKPFKQLREEYHAMNADKRPTWEEYIKPYIEIEEKHEKAHKLYKKPDPDCKNCGGSGKHETRYNPDSKWDWYTLGGRWTGYWKLKPSAKKRINVKEFLGRPSAGKNRPLFDVDMARKKNIDFKAMKKILREQAEEHWSRVQKALKGKDERAKSTAQRDMLWSGASTKEEYIKECRHVATFAVLMNGEWYEQGKMGWWGIVADKKAQDVWEEEFWKLIEKLPPNTWLSIYDCHI